MIFKVTLRNLIAHKVRLALTALAVILGVAFVAGTLVFTDTMGKQFDDLFAKTGKGIDVQVRAKKVLDSDDQAQLPTVPATLVDRIRAVPGVTKVHGDVAGQAALIGRNGKVVGGGGPPQLGVDFSADDKDHPMKAGRGPQRAGEVAIDDETAAKAGLRIGDRTRVIIQGPVQDVTIVGTLDAGNLMGATVTAFDQQTAQRLLLRPGRFSDITVTASGGVSETALRDRISPTLPAGYEAVTGTKVRDENKTQVATLLSFFRTFLLVFAVISIFVGGFIIFNTFSMLVAQRSRELALLRAVGASRKQVTRAVLGEAIGVGVVGSTLGLAAGAGLAFLLQQVFKASGADFGGGLVITYKPVLWAYVVGIVVTVSAAYFPARRAAKVPPVAAMRDNVAMPQRSLRIRLGVGSAITLGGAVLSALGLTGRPIAMLGAGAALVFLGVAMLAPVISRPVVRVLGLPYPRLFKTPGRLATQNALRNPRRTAATASALMIGLALVSAINVMSSSAKASVADQVDRTFAADYLVSASTQGGFSPAEPVRSAQSVPGVEKVTTAYRGEMRLAGKQVGYYATKDPADLERAARMKIVSGSAQVGRDGLLVDEPTARKRHWQVGSTVGAVFAEHGGQRLRVAGIYAENQIVGARLLALPAYLAHTEKPAADSLLITATKAGADTKSGLERALAGYPNLKVQDQSDVKRDAEKSIDQLVTLLTVLLTLSIIIAALGIINTLALSVIERTREIGLLRAVGTSRRQTRRMIRLESVVIAVFGALLGITIGVLFGIAIQRAVSDDGLNVLSVPIPTLLIYLLLSGLIGILAAAWPARRAARLDILKAIGVQ